MGDGEGEPRPVSPAVTSSGGCRTFCRYFFSTSSGVLPVGTRYSVGHQDKLDVPERGEFLVGLKAEKASNSLRNWI